MVLVLISMGVREDTRSQLFLSLLALAVVLAAYWLQARRGFAGLAVAGPAAPAWPLHAVGTALMRARCRCRPRASSSSPTRRWVPTSSWASCGGCKNELSAEYFVCVPAHPLLTGQGAAWSADASVIAAQHRLDQVMAILEARGCTPSGALGDYRPLHAHG